MIKLSVLLVLIALAYPLAAEQPLLSIDELGILDAALDAAHQKHPNISQGDLVPQYFLQIHCIAEDQDVRDFNDLRCTADLQLMLKSSVSEPVIKRTDSGNCVETTQYEELIVSIFPDGSSWVSGIDPASRGQVVECPEGVTVTPIAERRACPR